MAENSNIEWTTHTFNPWIGCQKVGPGCDHCYAEAWDARGLPALVPTNRLTPPKADAPDYREWHAVHRAPPGPDRWKFRSRTFQGVAEACADQWGTAAREQEQSA